MQRGVRQCDLRQLFVGVLRGRRRPVYEMFEHEGGRSTNQNGKHCGALFGGATWCFVVVGGRVTCMY